MLRRRGARFAGLDAGDPVEMMIALGAGVEANIFFAERCLEDFRFTGIE